MMIPPRALRLQIYKNEYEDCVVQVDASGAASRIQSNQARYQTVATAMGIPWWTVGILHMMESDCDFTTHLANGDPLTARTIHVPKGLIADVDPPYTWEQAAIAALQDYKQGWGSLSVVDQPTAMLFFEQWNGLGCWELNPPQPSAYLLAGTNLYIKGKFGSDGVWDPDLVSSQIGCVPLLKLLT